MEQEISEGTDTFFLTHICKPNSGIQDTKENFIIYFYFNMRYSYLLH